MATRVYKQCQSTTTTGPSLGNFIALQNVVRLVDFPHRCANPFSGARGEILATTALFASPGQREVDPSVHFLQTMQRTANGSLSRSPSSILIWVDRPFVRLPTIPSVTLALPRRVTTDQEKRV